MYNPFNDEAMIDRGIINLFAYFFLVLFILFIGCGIFGLGTLFFYLLGL